MWKNSQKHRRVEREQREELQSGQKEDRIFVDEGASLAEGGTRRARWNSAGVRAGRPRRRKSHSAGRLGKQRSSRDAASKKALGVVASKSMEHGEE